MTQRNSLIKSDELHIVSFVALANAALTDCVSVRHTAGQTPGNKRGGGMKLTKEANHNAARSEQPSGTAIPATKAPVDIGLPITAAPTH